MVAEVSSVKLMNKKAVKEQITAESKRVHGDKYTRISSEAYAYLNEALHRRIIEMVSSQDETGKTIKPPALVVAD